MLASSQAWFGLYLVIANAAYTTHIVCYESPHNSSRVKHRRRHSGKICHLDCILRCCQSCTVLEILVMIDITCTLVDVSFYFYTPENPIVAVGDYVLLAFARN
ncbi:hypothetical protein K450DRAFT_235307 [Umbelopsis ramanniana AG]|uniref:Secreted protein n=1 Tax=Umbelopsis ramanniana AG TaxID=1314678 RepID=A0AAD5EDG3_UMBRA|nr:uncharacterized protein K450DRAFT_235307 [Umbelopsis ramanniana AG]KAI8580931.1 hypothetical protein K450DRAFT_235307 [Umbelopsis ramanniana AG]